MICTALNDAHMDGLLTVIHSEREGDGMSSLQTDLPLLTDYDEQAIKTFIKEFEVSAMTASLFSHCNQSHQQRLHLLSQTEMSRACGPSPGDLICTPRSDCSVSPLIKHIAHFKPCRMPLVHTHTRLTDWNAAFPYTRILKMPVHYCR